MINNISFNVRSTDDSITNSNKLEQAGIGAFGNHTIEDITHSAGLLPNDRLFLETHTWNKSILDDFSECKTLSFISKERTIPDMLGQSKGNKLISALKSLTSNFLLEGLVTGAGLASLITCAIKLTQLQDDSVDVYNDTVADETNEAWKDPSNNEAFSSINPDDPNAPINPTGELKESVTDKIESDAQQAKNDAHKEYLQQRDWLISGVAIGGAAVGSAAGIYGVRRHHDLKLMPNDLR